MESKKKIVAIVLAWIGFQSFGFGQQLAEGERAGLIQATGSIYPAVQLNSKGVNYYVGGFCNYHLDDHFAFRGDIYSLAGSREKPSYIKNHTQVQAGFTRSFPIKRFDPFVGIQMGVSMLETAERSGFNYNASLSVLGGFQFHVYTYFFFFAEVQYTHQQDPTHLRPLDQILATGGLGFQLPTKRKKS